MMKLTLIKREILDSLQELTKLSKEEIVEDRYNKFRNMGEFIQTK